MSTTSWLEAMRTANERFYAQHAPEDAFRTSMVSAPLMAQALLTVIRTLDTALAHPPAFDIVDIGAGSGAFLAALHLECGQEPAAPSPVPPLSQRLRLHGIDLRPRPQGLDRAIRWTTGRAPGVVPSGIVGMVLAHEWLDDVPVDPCVRSSDGRWQRLHVTDDGREEFAALAATDPARDWITTWWNDGALAENGQARDDAWSGIAECVDAGALIAIDYGHTRHDRPEHLTLTGFAEGGTQAPVADGSMNITAHVALDACAEAARHAIEGRGRSGDDLILTQNAALDSLLTPAGSGAAQTPRARLDAIARHGRRAELVDPQGLGAHLWLVQTVDAPLPFERP